MHHLNKSAFIGFLAFALALSNGGKVLGAPSEYKPADENFYLRASVLKAEPSAVILSAGEYQQKDGFYFVETRHQAPREVYVEVLKDWLEPVTPPNMPASLGLAPDVMQIREPQGDVEVAPPDNPTGFVPATEGMPIANGAVVKTGKDGTAAVLFGGIDSARLIPGSEAMVQQTVTPDLRSTRVDLKLGVVFSKVGLRRGEKQDYEVHTPFGVAMAKGTDFVCVALPDHTDVWIAQGTVRFDQPNGQTVGTVRSAGKGALKIIRFPAIKDAHLALEATTETMTEALNFIPLVNVKLKTLHDQMAQGVKLGAQEIKYLSLIKHVPCLIRLAVVEPPAAPPMAAPPVPAAPAPPPMAVTPPAPAPMATTPAPLALAPTPALLPTAPIAPAPEPRRVPVIAAPASPAIDLPATTETKGAPVKAVIEVASDGSIHFQGAQLSSGELERKLADIAKTAPEFAVVIRGDRDTEGGRIRTVLAMCHQAKLQNVSFDLPADGDAQPVFPDEHPMSTSPKETAP